MNGQVSSLSQKNYGDTNIELTLIKTLTETDKTTHSKISSNFLPVVFCFTCYCLLVQMAHCKFSSTIKPFSGLWKNHAVTISKMCYGGRDHTTGPAHRPIPHTEVNHCLWVQLWILHSHNHTVQIYSFYSTLLPWQPNWRKKLQLLLVCSSVSSLHISYKNHLLWSWEYTANPVSWQQFHFHVSMHH